jgi:hypothetical protein
MTLTFHGIVPKEWIAGEVRTHADTLEEHCDDIREWHVAVDLRHRHHKAGDRFNVRIAMLVPGEELAVTHGANLPGSKQDLDEKAWMRQFDVGGMRRHLRLVIKEAFDEARGRLENYTHRRRHAVNMHERPVHGAA